MLSSPSTENAVNAEASNAYELTPAMYRQMVFDCVTASKRIAGDFLKPFLKGKILQSESERGVNFDHHFAFLTNFLIYRTFYLDNRLTGQRLCVSTNLPLEHCQYLG